MKQLKHDSETSTHRRKNNNRLKDDAIRSILLSNNNRLPMQAIDTQDDEVKVFTLGSATKRQNNMIAASVVRAVSASSFNGGVFIAPTWLIEAYSSEASEVSDNNSSALSFLDLDGEPIAIISGARGIIEEDAIMTEKDKKELKAAVKEFVEAVKSTRTVVEETKVLLKTKKQ